MTLPHLKPYYRDERLVSLEGVGNFRDLGGYKTTDGNQVAWGQLYRSASLYNATPEDIVLMKEQLRIRHVIDFRKARETDLEPEPEAVMDFAKYHWVAIELDGTAREDIDRKLEQAEPGDVFSELLIDVNRLLVTNHVEEMKRWFSILLKEQGGFLFHCTEGKDRTGFSSAILLSALGVDDEQIMSDYMMTNTVHKHSIEERVKRSRVLSSFDIDVNDIRRLLMVEEDYLNAAFEQIRKDFDSVPGYLEEAIGIKSSELEQLKDKFLQ